MKDQEFDRILSHETDLVPSSGFAATVMDAVRNEACAPPPIPFPWARALPGIAAGVFALVYLFIGVFRQAGSVADSPSSIDRFFSSLVPAFRAAQMMGAGWILAALVLTYLCVKLSFLFARRNS